MDLPGHSPHELSFEAQISSIYFVNEQVVRVQYSLLASPLQPPQTIEKVARWSYL
jgi:hypothetical protein